MAHAAIAVELDRREQSRIDANSRAESAERQLRGEKTPAPVNGVDVAVLQKRVTDLEKAVLLKDAEIADKAERINRLTERLVRVEGLN
jgi:enhancing lycopene biosynthesis protein 2